MIYFIGAGPGDPELLTIKGKRLIDEADTVVYAGSLVNPEVLAGCGPGTEIRNSAEMDLDEVIEVMSAAHAAGKKVVRVHTGDPAVYGAIREQMDRLDDLGIGYEVVPGVSSVFACAAALKKEFTLPGVSQTVILTRMEGRTPVPDEEGIAALARHRATMAIFLSAGMIDDVVAQLIAGGYPPETPAAVVHKASWPDQKEVVGDLRDIGRKVAAAGISKTAIILVGGFLGDVYELSKLYDPAFTTEYRQGRPA